MALTGRALAWMNLAWRFGVHVTTRLPRRALRRTDDLARFLDAVEPEGYVALEPAERELMPAAMSCVHCGLCSLACPSLRDAPATAWDEPWTFVAGPSRSIDRARIVAAGLTPCTDCSVCAAICPTGVPIPQLAALVRRMAQPRES